MWILWTKNTKIRLHGTHQNHEDPETVDLKAPRLAQDMQTAWKKHQNTVYWVYIKLAQKRGFRFFQTRSNTIIVYRHASRLLYPEGRLPPQISFKDNWMNELGSEVAGGGKDSQQTQPKDQKSDCLSGGTSCVGATVLFAYSGNRKRCLTWLRNTNVTTALLVFQLCAMSVKRIDEDKDADENVDADQTSTERLVSGQSIGLFTQCHDIDIDFRVSGLPHAVVKQTENIRVRELVKNIESRLHREGLQADLQQNNVYKPIQWRFESDDSWNWQCRVIRAMRNNSEGAMLRKPSLLESRNLTMALERNWSQPTFSPMAIGRSLNPALRHQEWCDLVVLGTAELKHRKSILWSKMLEGDVSKRNLKEFTIVSNEIQYIVFRNSKLAGQRRSALQWIDWHRKTNPTAHLMRSMREASKTGTSRWTNQAEMHRWNSDQTSEQQSQFWTVSTVNLEKNDLNPIPFHQYQRWHSSSSSSTSWWQWNETLVELLN